MLFNRALSLLIASTTVHQCVADEEASANELPVILKQEFSTVEYGALEKRDTCPGGGQCIIGDCCGEGCASNCCGHDEGGVGCGIAQRCQFDGNVFIGCCANLVGGCTGTPTRITIHTPYNTVRIQTDDTLPATDASATPTADVTSGTRSSTDADSSLSTASVASTRTTPTPTSSFDNLSTSTTVETSTTSTVTSSESDRSTSETTSSDPFSISSFDSGSTPTQFTAAEETTSTGGAAGMTFGSMEMGSLLAFGAWFLGTA